MNHDISMSIVECARNMLSRRFKGSTTTVYHDEDTDTLYLRIGYYTSDGDRRWYVMSSTGLLSGCVLYGTKATVEPVVDKFYKQFTDYLISQYTKQREEKK